MSEQHYNENAIPYAVGSVNIGANCHFNSLIQCLLSCPSFNELIMNQRHKAKDNPVHAAILNLIEPNLKAPRLNPMNTRPMLNAIRSYLKDVKKIPNDFGSQQEDAHEGFHLLIDALDNTDIEELFGIEYRQDIYCPTCSKVVSHSSGTELYMELDVNVRLYAPDESKSQVENYILKNIRDVDDYRCEQCNELVQAKKVYRIQHAPSIIVLTMMKYLNKYTVEAPSELLFGASDKVKESEIKYKLVGQVEHSGGRGGGHYVARALRRAGVKMFNDTSVSNSEFADNRNTYMLFYHRI